MISESTINKVRNLPIENVLKPYVELSKKGFDVNGLVPFPFGTDSLIFRDCP